MPRRANRLKRSESAAIADWEMLEDDDTDLVFGEDDSILSWQSIGEQTSLSPQSKSVASSIASDESMSVASRVTVVGATAVGAPREILESVEASTIGKKAVKADEAEVPVHLWDMRIARHLTPESKAKVEALCPQCKARAWNGFREFGLRMFRKALYRDCMMYLETEFTRNWKLMSTRSDSGKLTRLGKELEAIRNILWHACQASWFEYHRGSRVHHFRFPIRYRTIARDGVPIYFQKHGPTTKQAQPGFADETIRDRVKPKIEKVINRRYMIVSEINLKSLIKYFAVPKGEDDIRIVYDATASGLNEAVWAPTFWLPTIDSLVRALDDNCWMADRDIGDMFLNFMLHESAWEYAGVDIKPIRTGEGTNVKSARWYHWVRNAMGFAPSPYNSIKLALIAEEVVRGDRLDPANPFQWKDIRLNLPGTWAYNPSISWI